LEVFYGSTCGHCLAFMRAALLPLIRAKLPGDRLQLTLLPWVPDALSADECLANLPCSYARAPLCVLNRTFPQPVRIDSEELRRSLEFLYCDLSNTALGATPPQNKVELPRCASKAGIPWSGHHGMKACAEGSGALKLLDSSHYRQRVEAAKHKLSKVQDQMAPFVFFNGEVLICQGPEWCTGLRTPSGDRHFSKPGGLLEVVCARLHPVPSACKAVLARSTEDDGPSKIAKHGVKEAARACENCVEVGAFAWQYRPRDRAEHQNKVAQQVSAIVALASAAAFLGIVVANIASCRWSCWTQGCTRLDQRACSKDQHHHMCHLVTEHEAY